MVLPEDLCERLAALAESDSRTVSNMAKVLIQQGVEQRERELGLDGASASSPAASPIPVPAPAPTSSASPARRDVSSARGGGPAGTERFREALERQEQGRPKRLRGAPRRVRLQRPGA